MDIFQEIARALQEEEQIMLATIISTTGSTPAAELSKMIVKNHGLTTLGTVGGGCLEAEVLSAALGLWGKGQAAVRIFHLTEDNTESGLICGGSLEVLIEPLDRSFVPVLEHLLRTRADGEDGALVTILEEKKPVSKLFLRANDCAVNLSSGTQPISHIRKRALEVIETHAVAHVGRGTEEIFIEPVAGQPRLIIFGGGHLSKFVCQLASQVGFRVTVIDDRVAFANRERFPEAAEVLCDDFLGAIEQLQITPNTYIAIITRGHKFDELILEHVIDSKAKYIGVIGSKRKILTAYRHYLQKGIPREKMDRVHAPIGLDIGAVTAEEIALSIVAELIRVRRGGSGPVPSMSDPMPGLLATVEERSKREAT